VILTNLYNKGENRKEKNHTSALNITNTYNYKKSIHTKDQTQAHTEKPTWKTKRKRKKERAKALEYDISIHLRQKWAINPRGPAKQGFFAKGQSHSGTGRRKKTGPPTAALGSLGNLSFLVKSSKFGNLAKYFCRQT